MHQLAIAGGKLDALPSGSTFLRVVSFAQPGGTTVRSATHQAGVIYQLAGRQRLRFEDGSQTDIQAGDGYFLPSLAHSHHNPDPTTNHWYFISVWPTSARAEPLPAPGLQLYATDDLAPATQPAAGVFETLRLVSLEAGGHSPAHQFGGLELLIVLAGTITIRSRGRPDVQLAADAGAYVPRMTPTEETNTAPTEARYLVFLVTPVGQEIEAILDRVP